MPRKHLYEVTVTRSTDGETVDMVVRAESPKNAEAKAKKEAVANECMWFMPRSEPEFSARADLINFTPDCEVIE